MFHNLHLPLGKFHGYKFRMYTFNNNKRAKLHPLNITLQKYSIKSVLQMGVILK